MVFVAGGHKKARIPGLNIKDSKQVICSGHIHELLLLPFFLHPWQE